MRNYFFPILLLLAGIVAFTPPPTELVTGNTVRAVKELKMDTITVTKFVKVINSGSTDRFLPTAKSVWTLFQGCDRDTTDDITDETTLGGDLSGHLPNPTVVKLQGRPVANTSPTTGYVLRWNGTAWAPALSGSVSEYAVTVTSGNSGATLRVVATGSGVTAAYSSGEITITVPEGVTLLSGTYRGAPADIQTGPDAGGSSNWVRLKIAGLGGNTGLTDMHIPVVQKVIFASGSPSLMAPYTVNQGNNPAQAIVGVASGAITFRFSGMGGATNGYLLNFSGI